MKKRIDIKYFDGLLVPFPITMMQWKKESIAL